MILTRERLVERKNRRTPEEGVDDREEWRCYRCKNSKGERKTKKVGKLFKSEEFWKES